jgi:hypothetical protein
MVRVVGVRSNTSARFPHIVQVEIDRIRPPSGAKFFEMTPESFVACLLRAA